MQGRLMDKQGARLKKPAEDMKGGCPNYVPGGYQSSHSDRHIVSCDYLISGGARKLLIS